MDHSQLPHLLRLIDDDTPAVREAVLDALAAFGPDLEEALAALSDPPSADTVMFIKGLLAQHLWGYVALIPDEAEATTSTFRPGQIVRHREYGYRGVVVEADPECRADMTWYLSNTTQPSRSQPWYHVLVHGSMQVTYAAQVNLELDSGGEVVHPYLPYFFSGYRDGEYVRNDQPWPS